MMVAASSSSTIVAHLQARHPGPVKPDPARRAGLEVHMLDRVFDNYVMTPCKSGAGCNAPGRGSATPMA